MALTQFIRVSATILDALNVQAIATCYAEVDPSDSVTSIIAFYNSWLGYLDAVIDGQIINAAITVLPGLPGGLKSSPVSTSRCMNTGIINFTATGSPNRWGFAIPAISSSGTVQSGGKLIITGGSPINNLYTFLLATSTTLEWSNSSAQLLATFCGSSLSTRKYRVQLAGLSDEA